MHRVARLAKGAAALEGAVVEDAVVDRLGWPAGAGGRAESRRHLAIVIDVRTAAAALQRSISARVWRRRGSATATRELVHIFRTKDDSFCRDEGNRATRAGGGRACTSGEAIEIPLGHLQAHVVVVADREASMLYGFRG